MAHVKDMRLLVRQAVKAGCEARRLSNGHTRLTAPNEARLDISFSPSTAHGVREQQFKVRKFLRQNGLQG